MLGRRLRAEEGISLVEVLVSIVLIGLVLAALASSLTASMASARQTETGTHATALANEEFERLQGLAWQRLGFSASDGNLTATAGFNGVSGYRTVVVDPSVSGAPAVISPPIVRGGRSYTVRRFIVWRCNDAVETTTGCPDTLPRYKQFRVEVWQGGERRTSLEGKRAIGTGGVGGSGGGLDLSDDLQFRIVSLTVSPDPVYVQNNGRLVVSSPTATNGSPLCPPGSATPLPGCGPTLVNAAGAPTNAAMQIDVETSDESSAVSVHWGGTPVAMTPVGVGAGCDAAAPPSTWQCLRWTYSIFPTSSAFAAHGPLDVTATATPVAPVPSATDTTQAYIAYPIALQTATLTYDSNAQRTYTGTVSESGDHICVANHGRLVRNDHPFSVDIRGLTEDDSVWVSRVDGTSWTADMLPGAVTGSQTTFGTTLAPEFMQPFTGTWTVLRFSWVRSYDNVTGLFNFPLAVRIVGNGNTNVC